MPTTTVKSPADPRLQSDPWGWWRDRMPVVAKWSYLDHAAVGPLSRPAADAIREYAGQAESEGDTVWPTWAAQAESLRRRAATLLGTDPAEVCLVPNTSTGINLVAEGFPWNPGDSVIVPEGEFPSNLFPWQNQQSRGVELRIVPRREGRVEVEDLLRHVDQTTRMIALSWVGYASGYRVDLEELVARAHDRDVLVFLDAIQGLGVFDLDLGKIDLDFLAADGHKWMLGPEGMGIAMIRRRHLDRLRCGNVGWSSVQNAFNYSDPQLELRSTAARFEPGSANMPGAIALDASLEIFAAVRREHGPNAIADRVLSLVAEVHARLAEIGIRTRLAGDPDRRSGIVTFEVPEHDPAEVRRHLLERHCVVSCRGGGIRVSIHAYNNSADITQLVDSLAELSGTGRF